MKLNEKIFSCRKRASLSQEELAARIGVSRQAVSKWELGTAVPELDKLLALAKEFSVTTDWLLSDEFEDAEEDNFEQAEDERSEQLHTWVQDVPGVIGKLLRRYGWLFGVYIFLGGVGFTFVGGLARKMVSSMMSMIPGGMFVTGDWGGAMTNPYGIDTFMQNNPVYLMGTAIMWVGVALMVIGAVLAVILKKKSKS